MCRSQFGDQECVFSANVIKISRKFKLLPRTFVVTDKAIYHLVPKPAKGLQYVVRRRTPLDQVDSISLSALADDYIVIHIPSVL